MCFSKPNIPAPPPPPQEMKQPDNVNTLQKNRQAQVGYGQGTILTGPTGITANALNTGGNTVLGS